MPGRALQGPEYRLEADQRQERRSGALVQAPALSLAWLLLDHIIGLGEERSWDRKPESLCTLGTDYQLEPRRLQNGEFARSSSLECPTRVVADLPIGVQQTWAVAHQAAD